MSVNKPLGRIQIVGIGPGAKQLITPQVQTALNEATDLIGYSRYLDQITIGADQTKHASDNRQELERAKHAFQLACEGRNIVIISSGDPGVFAMASAVFEALEQGDPKWKQIAIDILPGITAMLAAAARIGAPLGHDFCAINLSNNLKSDAVIEMRVRMAIRGDFALAFYNPRSQARPSLFRQIIDIIRHETKTDLLCMFARNIFCADEQIIVKSLSEVIGDEADMRTIVLIGNQSTRKIIGSPYIYTPRSKR